MRTASLTLSLSFLALLAFCFAAPSPAAAGKGKKMKSCAGAVVDSDGDGLTDCRESKQLRTSPTKVDTDDDGISDGDEVAEHCDPLDHDSDHDGTDDGDDETPGIPKQEVKAFVDALTCPQPGVPGSLTALGITVILDENTEFEDATCEDIAALLAMATGPVRAEVDVLEDSAGVLTAAEVELEHEHGDDDQGEDDE